LNARIHRLAQPEWRGLAAGFRDHGYRQLWAFAEACASRAGATHEAVVVCDGDTVAGLAAVRVKRVPMLGAGIAYVNGGPLVRKGDAGDRERLRVCLKALQDEYVARRGLLLRVSLPLGPPAWNVAQETAFVDAGFVLTSDLRRYRTFVLDLDRTRDEIARGFTQRWRRSLKRANAAGLQVVVGDSHTHFARFLDLYTTLLERKRFTADLAADFYARVQAQLENGERFQILLALKNGEPVSGLVLSLLGDTGVFLLAASNETGMACSASFLVQWEALAFLQHRDMKSYDLGGIDPDENPGVYEFKRGLGGVDITAPGPFEVLPRRLAGAVISAAEGVYRRLRALRRRAGRLT